MHTSCRAYKTEHDFTKIYYDIDTSKTSNGIQQGWACGLGTTKSNTGINIIVLDYVLYDPPTHDLRCNLRNAVQYCRLQHCRTRSPWNITQGKPGKYQHIIDLLVASSVLGMMITIARYAFFRFFLLCALCAYSP